MAWWDSLPGIRNKVQRQNSRINNAKNVPWGNQEIKTHLPDKGRGITPGALYKKQLEAQALARRHRKPLDPSQPVETATYRPKTPKPPSGTPSGVSRQQLKQLLKGLEKAKPPSALGVPLPRIPLPKKIGIPSLGSAGRVLGIGGSILGIAQELPKSWDALENIGTDIAGILTAAAGLIPAVRENRNWQSFAEGIVAAKKQQLNEAASSPNGGGIISPTVYPFTGGQSQGVSYFIDFTYTRSNGVTNPPPTSIGVNEVTNITNYGDTIYNNTTVIAGRDPGTGTVVAPPPTPPPTQTQSPPNCGCNAPLVAGQQNILDKLNNGLQIPSDAAQLALLNTINTKLGDQVTGGISGFFGDKFTKLWNHRVIDRAINIYQATTNIFSALTDSLYGISESIELVGKYNSKIGNALRASGTVLEDSYNWMSESWNAKAGRVGAIQRFINNLNTAQEVAEDIENITSNAVNVQENLNTIKTESQAIKEQFETKETEKKDEQDVKKNNSSSPNIQVSDLIKPES